MSKEKLKAYLESLVGKKAVDVDGAYGVQCVDLVKLVNKQFYGIEITTLGDGRYAAENTAKKFPDKFEYIPYSENLKPQTGDVVSYYMDNPCGHVAVVVSDTVGDTYRIIHQWNGSGTIQKSEKKIIPPKDGVKYSIISVARPIFSDGKSEKKTEETAEFTIDELACKVRLGDYGDGAERVEKLTKAGYDAREIQDRVNEMIAAEKAEKQDFPYSVKITASALNVRNGPGTDNEIVKTLINGSIHTVVEESAGKGAEKWGKLKSETGWISLDYTKKV
jgi:hypothetical protein